MRKRKSKKIGIDLETFVMKDSNQIATEAEMITIVGNNELSEIVKAIGLGYDSPKFDKNFKKPFGNIILPEKDEDNE